MIKSDISWESEHTLWLRFLLQVKADQNFNVFFVYTLHLFIVGKYEY